MARPVLQSRGLPWDTRGCVPWTRVPDEPRAAGKEAHARLGLEYPGAGASPKKEGWRVPPAGKEARTVRLMFSPPKHEPV